MITAEPTAHTNIHLLTNSLQVVHNRSPTSLLCIVQYSLPTLHIKVRAQTVIINTHHRSQRVLVNTQTVQVVTLASNHLLLHEQCKLSDCSWMIVNTDDNKINYYFQIKASFDREV